MRLFACPTFLLLVVSLIRPTLQGQEAPAYKADPKYAAAVAEGKQQLKQHHYIFAEDAFKKANKIAGGRDADCLKNLFTIQSSVGSYKDALKTIVALDELARTPKEKADVATDRGTVLFRQAGEKGKPELLQAADESLKAAIALDPKNPSPRYVDGRVLAREGKMEAAQEAFKECLSCLSTKDPSYVRIQHFAANPVLATAKMAPAFVVTALDGKKFNLDEMGGRVVLIDFWATWCGPCNEELPHLKKIAQEFAGQPLVIISVSWDADEEKWKSFIAKNNMTWVQYRDADHALSSQFEVSAFRTTSPLTRTVS